jgi:TonB family protein
MWKDVRHAAVVLCTAAGAFAGLAPVSGAQENAPKPPPTAWPLPTAPPCARPNVAATTFRPATAILPAIAEQQGIAGTVRVIVSLDQSSNLVGARIMTSPSAVLNPAALAAVRATTFQTEIRDCRPLAADYVYPVDFIEKATFSPTSSGAQIVTVIGEGTATRPADVADVLARITTVDATATDATAKNDALLTHLKTALAPLGIGEADVHATSYVQPASPTVSRATASLQIEIAVANVANAAHVAAVASTLKPIDVRGIRFALRDRESAYREARSAALNDAEQAAREAVARRQLHLGALTHANGLPRDPEPPPRGVVPVRLIPVSSGFQEFDVRVPDLELRITATVTYAVKP